MERRRFGNTDLIVSAIGLGCYGMSGAYGSADDAQSIATIRHALDLGVNLLDTSASYGNGHNHRLIGEAIRGRRHEAVIHSKSGSPRDGGAEAVRGGGDPRYLRQTCEESLKNLGIEALDVFCMSRVDPNVPIEESVGAMADLVREGKTRFISLSECSAASLRRGSAVHPLASLQMEYSLFSRDAEEQGHVEACKELGAAMMAYAVLGRGMLSAQPPRVEEFTADDIRARLPRFDNANLGKNLQLRAALEAVARAKNATLAQLAIAWPMAQRGHLYRPDTGRQIAPASRRECGRRGDPAHRRRSRGNRAYRAARRRFRHTLPGRTNGPSEPMTRRVCLPPSIA